MIAAKNKNILDVRLIEPKLKHLSIFKAFDELKGGEVLTILNDHDPLPLYYQFKAERPNIFTWQYIEEGPEVWEVNITRDAGADSKTVGEVVRDNPKSATVFKKYKIDYCCNGKKTIEEACARAGISPAQLKAEIDAQALQPTAHLRVQDWPLEVLVDYIIHNHHLYVKKAGNDIKGLVDKVARVHGDRHPELLNMRQYFYELMSELESHMDREEQVLFPAIKKLAKEGKSLQAFSFGSVENPIRMMEMEHEEAGVLLEAIRKEADDYALPEGACTSYRLLFNFLQDFEEDLHQHIHLENNILFPKAKEAEAQAV